MYQEYNSEIVDSDDEDDLSKMDMGGQVSDLLFCLFVWNQKHVNSLFMLKNVLFVI